MRALYQRFRCLSALVECHSVILQTVHKCACIHTKPEFLDCNVSTLTYFDCIYIWGTSE
jgi:hypothetical protein